MNLESLHEDETFRIFVKNPASYYVENEGLRTIAAIKREGLVFCRYFPQNSRDNEALQNISGFLAAISSILG